LLVPLTVALNVAMYPALSETVDGEIDRDTLVAEGWSVTEALAVRLGLLTLLAMTVTAVWVVTDGGAVYSPLAIEPTFGTSDHDRLPLDPLTVN
jgi:hypothetical protein